MSSTREKIITEAMALIKQKGYHNWSYDHISKCVGIRKASIHYHFPSKENLVAEVLKIYIRDIFQKLESVKGSNYEKILELIGAYRTSYQSPNEICLCTILASDYETLSEETAFELRTFYEKLHVWLTVLFQEGIKAKEFKKHIDAKTTAFLLISTLQGLLVTSKISKEKVFDASVEQFFALIAEK